MNIYDISSKAGVSIATVSRVINGNSYVSDKTRQKVLAVIEECGYTPNAFARGLGLNSMKTVGIMCADSSDPYIAKAIYHIEQDLRSNNYDALLCCTGFELKEKEKYMSLLLLKRVDAIILVGSNYVEGVDARNQYIREAAKSVPVMIINGSLGGENIYNTLTDDYQAIYDATRALLGSGREKILYLNNAKSYSGNKKLAGYIAATEASSFLTDKREDYIHFFNGSLIKTKEYLTSLLRKGLLFDAIVTADDTLAISALKFAKENQISVPDQLSIIGYNNSIIAQYSDPELTSIDNKLETVCLSCVQTLMGVLKGQSMPLKTVFSCEIIKRGTTSF
ncbi:MAG: transcriptional regulator, LacI family [Herbinix sp.]|jgi:LacI family transcriptional regulator/LacI family asc operon transcriptional repressor|nr:transcriptional regulator, LacI family [Herbinix sp.]